MFVCARTHACKCTHTHSHMVWKNTNSVCDHAQMAGNLFVWVCSRVCVGNISRLLKSSCHSRETISHVTSFLEKSVTSFSEKNSIL